jgi:hypothetical protein
MPLFYSLEEMKDRELLNRQNAKLAKIQKTPEAERRLANSSGGHGDPPLQHIPMQ